MPDTRESAVLKASLHRSQVAPSSTGPPSMASSGSASLLAPPMPLTVVYFPPREKGGSAGEQPPPLPLPNLAQQSALFAPAEAAAASQAGRAREPVPTIPEGVPVTHPAMPPLAPQDAAAIARSSLLTGRPPSSPHAQRHSIGGPVCSTPALIGRWAAPQQPPRLGRRSTGDIDWRPLQHAAGAGQQHPAPLSISCARARMKADAAAAAQLQRRQARAAAVQPQQRAQQQKAPVSFPVLPGVATSAQLPAGFLRGDGAPAQPSRRGSCSSDRNASAQVCTSSLLEAVVAQLAQKRREDAAADAPASQAAAARALPAKAAHADDARRSASERELSQKNGVPNLQQQPAAVAQALAATAAASAAAKAASRQISSAPAAAGAAAASTSAAAARSLFNVGSSTAAGRASVRMLGAAGSSAGGARSGRASLAHLPTGEAALQRGAKSDAAWPVKQPLQRGGVVMHGQLPGLRDSLATRRCATPPHI